jgi:hypothetical protein
MDAVFLTLLVVTMANLALAGFVLWHRPGAPVNRIFTLTAVSTAGWTFTNALFQQTISPQVVTVAAQFSYLSAVVLGASFLHFSWVFPLPREVSRGTKQLLWSSALLIGLLPFVPGMVIRSVNLSSNRSIDTTPGVYLIALFMLGSSFWAFGTFLWHHRKQQRSAREQSRYVLAGSALTAIIGLVCNLLLPLLHNYSLVWLGPASSLFFVGFTVYAIVTQRLFDIRIVIKRTLVYTLLLAAIAGGYSAKESLQRTAEGNQHPFITSVGGTIIVSLLVSPVRRWLEKRIDHLISAHDHRRYKNRPEHVRHEQME